MVYLRREQIRAEHPEALVLDDDTGEYYYADGSGLREEFVSTAIEVRLGNLAGIGFLRKEICSADASFPLICGRVVYSGSHTGDKIALEELDDLAAEIARLRTRTELSPEVLIFVTSLEQLIAAAREQGNPIVF